MVLADLGVRLSEAPHHGVGDLPQEGLAEAQHAPVAHGPAHDPAQHVAAPLVRRRHPVGDEEGAGSRMVGDHLHRHVVLLARAIGLAREGADMRDQRGEEVGVVVRHPSLQDRGDALEPHAGVDGRPGQRRQRAGGVAVVLHEDQVPDLQPAVALACRTEAGAPRPLLRAGEVVSLMEVRLRGRAAGPRVAHRPEVVLLAQTKDSVVGQPRHRLPQCESLVVVGEDRRLEALLGHREVLGQELPAEGDGVLLEVVAEGEIAQHLEEGMVAGGPAHVLEVVVLAAGADALLGGDRPDVVAPLLAEEDGLELVHPGIGEEERGVLGGDERRGRQHGVAVGREVFEEALPDLGAGHHGVIIPTGFRLRMGAPEAPGRR